MPTLGPICPTCRGALRDNLRFEHLAVTDPAQARPPRLIGITYCGSCGWTLNVNPARRTFLEASEIEAMEVVATVDETTLAGQFQLRCRDLVKEIEALGFRPSGWIAVINRLGASEAAKHLLAERRVLPVTIWLLDQGRDELTMEHEIEQERWNELFTDEERKEAAARLARARRQRD